jgi:hypothetical protein
MKLACTVCVVPCCTAGMVDWPVLLPQLYTRFMWAFEVPVGAATGSPPFCKLQGLSPGLHTLCLHLCLCCASRVGAKTISTAKTAWLLVRWPAAALTACLWPRTLSLILLSPPLPCPDLHTSPSLLQPTPRQASASCCSTRSSRAAAAASPRQQSICWDAAAAARRSRIQVCSAKAAAWQPSA